MPRHGTTKKQADAAIAKLKEAGFKAWGVADGHHYLWVVSSAFAMNCGRISVPSVNDFINKRRQEEVEMNTANTGDTSPVSAQ